MSFQKTASVVSIVILIICLGLIGYALYQKKYSSSFPPVVADCPDYWLDMSEGTGSNCINRQNLGDPRCSKQMDFSGAIWSGDDGGCRKNLWAKSCNLSWDGITNDSTICSTTE